MRYKLFTTYCTIFFLVSSTVMFAVPGDESENGDLEGPEPTAAPINNKLFILIIAGILYAYFHFSKKENQAQSN